MSEPSVELRRIDWKSILPFTLIFRTFKMACHPSTLGLAFLLVLFVGLWGSALDGIWGKSSRPVVGELEAYALVDDIDNWREQTLTAQGVALTALLMHDGIDFDLDDVEQHINLYKASPLTQVDLWLGKLETRFGKRMAEIDERYGDEMSDEDAEAMLQEKAELGDVFNAAYDNVKSLRPLGTFAAFMKYEQGVLRQMVASVCSLNIAGRFGDVLDRQPVEREDVGVLGCVVLAARGKIWMASEHPFFMLIAGLPALVVWALLAGAICRISVLFASRDERVPANSALAFAKHKFLSFFIAPLIPSLFIAAIGFFVLVGGLLAGIPFVGGIVPLFTFVAIALGAAITILIIGMLGGGFMFYSAIAAEGSDAFDAFSRSYSFVFTKPWNAALYAIITSIYGAICYLFVRFLAFVLLTVTRAFAGIGLGATSRPGLGVDATMIDGIWTQPTFDQMYIAPPVLGTHLGDGLAEWGVWLSVMLVILGVCAFLVSFFYSGATVIYLLLRRDVDGIDLDDVYLDEGEDEIGYFDSASLSEVEASAAEAPGVEALVEETPAAEPPAVEKEEKKQEETSPDDASSDGGVSDAND